MAKNDDLAGTKNLMAAPVQMKRKPHENTKIGNSKAKRHKSLRKKLASSSSSRPKAA
jgi:hypothetical protein